MHLHAKSGKKGPENLDPAPNLHPHDKETPREIGKSGDQNL